MVKNSATTKSAPTDSAAVSSNKPATGGKNTQVLFNSAAIGMSWQLAVVVIAPIVGGYKLDTWAHSSPLWTLVGLVVAMGGMILVVRRTLSDFNEMTKSDPTDLKENK
ncbi:MAG: AtpZ/AtpI family protein [Candidatus Saccharibacteria bacterium]